MLFCRCEIDREYFVNDVSRIQAMSESDKELFESLQILAESEEFLSPIRF